MHPNKVKNPLFEANVKSRRLNPVTKIMEAYVSGKEKVLRISFTWAVLLFMVRNDSSIPELKGCFIKIST